MSEDPEGAREGEFDLVTLRNGHRAVRHLPSGEVMHPSVGPWAEANLLYVEQLGLTERLLTPGPALRVFDVGLGAATNALAAIEAASSLGDRRRRELEVLSFERDLGPLRLAVGDPAGFSAQARWSHAARTLLETGRWSGPGLSWQLFHGELLEQLPQAQATGPGADLVFYDPFSPAVNPELWSVAALQKIHGLCRTDGPGALLATYSAATPTRLSFLLAGFFVGRGVGVGTKSETTVAATSLAALREPLGEAFLGRWRRSTSRAPHGEPFHPDLEARLLAHPQMRSK